MKLRRYKEELRESLYTKEHKRRRMRRGVKFLNGLFSTKKGFSFPGGML